MIGKLFMLGILSAGGYYAYQMHRNPAVIEQPVYAEMRVDMKVAGREMNTVLFAKMVDFDDCNQRSERVWKKVLQDCVECTFKSTECKTDLGKRYDSIFDGGTLYTTYVTADRGNRFERDGRIVVWGLTSDESKQFCQTLKGHMHKRYAGEVDCVFGHGT